MASNIGTGNSFATQNMKPASGEQADALWAQNLADNTGFLFHREVPLPLYADPHVCGFRKTPAHNAIKIVAVSTSDVTGYHGTIQIYPSGTQLTAGNIHSQQVYPLVNVAYAPNSYIMDLSGLTNGSYYDIRWVTGQATIRSAYAIHGTLATY